MDNSYNENIFSISYNWIQKEAIERIGRKLTCEELYCVKKGIELGILFDIDTVFDSAITEAVEICENI